MLVSIFLQVTEGALGPSSFWLNVPTSQIDMHHVFGVEKRL